MIFLSKESLQSLADLADAAMKQASPDEYIALLELSIAAQKLVLIAQMKESGFKGAFVEYIAMKREEERRESNASVRAGPH